MLRTNVRATQVGYVRVFFALACATRRWPAGSGVMRRTLVPLPNRPNPTYPGDAADLSIPQGYLSRVIDKPAITIGNDPSTCFRVAQTLFEANRINEG